jgi:Fic family protein
MAMKPPYTISSKILMLVSDITHLLGQYEGMNIIKPEPKLRKSNRVRTVQASLAIEGNTFAIEQVTAILDGKRVVGPAKEILEVQNTIRAYNEISNFKTHSSQSLRTAHGILMHDLIPDAGKWRTGNVGILQGTRVSHAAPQPKRVPELMEHLFSYLKQEKETHPLIISAIFHYELEFIHPFSDGNGRLGRLWQTAILTKYHSIFEFTPVESAVQVRQKEYYAALGRSDKEGSATPFIEFSLSTIHETLLTLTESLRPTVLTAEDRLALACNFFGASSFSRKEYLQVLKMISGATASRDLATGVASHQLQKTGDKALTKYKFISLLCLLVSMALPF